LMNMQIKRILLIILSITISFLIITSCKPTEIQDDTANNVDFRPANIEILVNKTEPMDGKCGFLAQLQNIREGIDYQWDVVIYDSNEPIDPLKEGFVVEKISDLIIKVYVPTGFGKKAGVRARSSDGEITYEELPLPYDCGRSLDIGPIMVGQYDSFTDIDALTDCLKAGSIYKIYIAPAYPDTKTMPESIDCEWNLGLEAIDNGGEIVEKFKKETVLYTPETPGTYNITVTVKDGGSIYYRDSIFCISDTENTTDEEVLEEPTIRLEIFDGPVPFSGDKCLYVVEAITTGDPGPSINFNRDDAPGEFGPDKSTIILNNPQDEFILEATAQNSAGTAYDSIYLTWGCKIEQTEQEDSYPDDSQDDDPSGDTQDDPGDYDQYEDPVDCPEINYLELHYFYEPPLSWIDPSAYTNPGNDWVWIIAYINGNTSDLEYQWALPFGFTIENYGEVILWDAGGELGRFDVNLDIYGPDGCSDSITETLYYGY